MSYSSAEKTKHLSFSINVKNLSAPPISIQANPYVDSLADKSKKVVRQLSCPTDDATVLNTRADVEKSFRQDTEWSEAVFLYHRLEQAMAKQNFTLSLSS